MDEREYQERKKETGGATVWGETETSSQKGAAPCATILDTITLWAQFPWGPAGTHILLLEPHESLYPSTHPL